MNCPVCNCSGVIYSVFEMADGTGTGSKKETARTKLGNMFGNTGTERTREVSELELLRARLKERNLIKVPQTEHKSLSEIFRQETYGGIIGFLRAMRAKDTKTAANIFFSGAFTLSPQYFGPLKDAIITSDMDVIPESYVDIMAAVSSLSALVVAVIVVFESWYFGLSFLWTVFGALAVSALAFFVTFTIAYTYPFQKVSSKRQNINTNLPFAINHMAAIASSGVPPEKAFEMMAEFKEYGAVSVESRNLVRQIKAFGKDTLSAIRHTATNTPSREMKELLYGILSVIETGGNLKDYLNEMSQIALFNYQLARRKYIEALSTYADVYTAILIAAPLFLVSILAVMNIVPGSLVGSLSIETVMKIGVYVLIPGMNIAFLLFISYTQPEM